MSWDEGYVSQIEYNRGYYRDLCPLAIKLALLANGYQAPSDHPLRYLELGFGQGLSLNIHAAACDGEFWGNDFNPTHASNAKAMAHACGANVTILDDSFAELAARTDLPAFDIIALHGVWTWISSENRKHILKIIESKLSLGGIVYISYNSSPGSTSMIPVRDLMMLHVNTMSPISAHISTKIQDAMSFMQQLMDADAAYLGRNPLAEKRLRDITKKDKPEYLAHEFFNADWAIMSFADVAKHLSDVGLTFCGNAKIIDLFSDSILPTTIKNLLSAIKDPLFYESVRDFCVNQTFRADLWLKGRRTLSKLQRLQILGEMRFTLVFKPSPEEELTLNSSLGKLIVDKEMAAPLIAVLEKNHFEPKSINELLNDASLQSFNLSQACDMMLTLCGVCVAPVHDEETIALLKPRTDKLNSYLINHSQLDEHAIFLASPVTGSGVYVPRMHQLSLLAMRNGFFTIEEIANFIWDVLSSRGQAVVTSEGVPCKDKHENINELTLNVASFLEARLPILTALKIS